MQRAFVSVILSWPILITAVSAAAERWVVQNEQLAVTFTAEARGGVTSLVDRASGRELAARQTRPQLFQLEFSTPASSKRLTVSNSDASNVEFAESDVGGGSVTLRFTNLSSAEVIAPKRP